MEAKCGDNLLNCFGFDCSNNEAGDYVIRVDKSCGKCTMSLVSLDSLNTTLPAPAVGDVVYSGGSCGTPTISWSAVAWATSYQIMQGSNVIANTTELNLNIWGAPLWATTYTVYAVNDLGVSSGLDILTYVTACSGVPDDPTGFTYTAIGGNTYECWDPELHWNASVDATSYDIFEYGILIKNVVGATTVLSGVTAGNHVFTIKAKNGSGSSSGVSIAVNVYVCEQATSNLYVGNGTDTFVVDPTTMTESATISAGLIPAAQDATHLYTYSGYVIRKYLKSDNSLVASYTHTWGIVRAILLDGPLLYFLEDTTWLNQVVVRKLTTSSMTIASGSTTQAVATANINRASMDKTSVYLFVAVDQIAMRITKTTMIISGTNIPVLGHNSNIGNGLVYNPIDSHVYVSWWATNLYRIDANSWTLVDTEAPGTSWGAITYVNGIGVMVQEVTGGFTKIQKINASLVRTTLYTFGAGITPKAPPYWGIASAGGSLFMPMSNNTVYKIDAISGSVLWTYLKVLWFYITIV